MGMKTLILGDPHLDIAEVGTPRWNATLKAFGLATRLAIQEGYRFVHTGDETDGPLSEPRWRHRTQKLVLQALRRFPEGRLMEAPIGNHSIPKHKWKDYPTAWKLNANPTPWDPSECMILDFCPEGQSAAEVQFNSKLSKIQPGAKHFLVIAHMLWEGTYEYQSTSVPTHENWFQEAWVEKLKKKLETTGHETVTIILGHDHTPNYRDIKNIPVWTIGTPTPLTYGDSDPRRLLIFDHASGEVTEIPLTNFLPEIRVQTREQLSQLGDNISQGCRVVIDITDPSSEDIHFVTEAVRKIRVMGGEVKNITKIPDIDNDAAAVQSRQIGLLKAWQEFETDPEVLKLGLSYLAEVSNE